MTNKLYIPFVTLPFCTSNEIQFIQICIHSSQDQSHLIRVDIKREQIPQWKHVHIHSRIFELRANVETLFGQPMIFRCRNRKGPKFELVLSADKLTFPKARSKVLSTEARRKLDGNENNRWLTIYFRNAHRKRCQRIDIWRHASYSASYCFDDVSMDLL